MELHQDSDIRDPCLKGRRSLSEGDPFSRSFSPQPMLTASTFLLLCLWLPLVGKLQQGLSELVNHKKMGIGNLVFDKSGEVPLGLDVMSSAEVHWPLLRQRIYCQFGILLHDSKSWGQPLPLCPHCFCLT